MFSKRHISNSIEILYNNNTQSEKITIENPIGHPSRREEAIPLLQEKFMKNVESTFSSTKANKIWNEILNLKKDDDVVKLLLKRGVSKKRENKLGETPFEVGKKYGKTLCCEILELPFGAF